MTYEEIESDFDRLIKEGFIPFFKERGFKIQRTKFVRQFSDVHQVFWVDKLMRKGKTGHKIMVIQPRFGFFNSDISKIIWPDEKRDIPKVKNCFIQYDLGLYSGTTFYNLGETVENEGVESLIERVKNELDRTLAPIFDEYKSLLDINSFLQSNKKHKSLDNIYKLHAGESEYETAFKIFYCGLAAFFIHTGQKAKAMAVLKRKYDIIMTPVSVNRPTLTSDSKYVDNISMEIMDFWQDIPFIKRLTDTYSL